MRRAVQEQYSNLGGASSDFLSWSSDFRSLSLLRKADFAQYDDGKSAFHQDSVGWVAACVQPAGYCLAPLALQGPHFLKLKLLFFALDPFAFNEEQSSGEKKNTVHNSIEGREKKRRKFGRVKYSEILLSVAIFVLIKIISVVCK